MTRLTYLIDASADESNKAKAAIEMSLEVLLQLNDALRNANVKVQEITNDLIELIELIELAALRNAAMVNVAKEI